MKNLFKTTLAILGAGIAMYGASAKAQIITEYTSEASFNAAITQIGTTITFEGFQTSLSGYTTYSGTNSFGSAVNFTDTDGNYAVTTGFSSNYNDLSTSLVGDGRTSQILAPIATGVTALGTQIFSGASTALTDTVDVFLVGNTSTTPDASFTVSADAVDNSTPTSFIGFTTSTGSIASVVFESSYPATGYLSPLPIDNVEIGTFVATPEPSTFACVLLGGALLLLVNRRKRLNV